MRKTKHRLYYNRFWVFFFHFLVFFFLLLFDFTGPAGKCVTLSSKPPVNCSSIISPHWKVWLSKHPTKLIRHSEASHGGCVWFKSKPKGVFLDRQQVIPSANVGSIHPNRTNVKFTWCKHRITNEPSSCSEGTKCSLTFYITSFQLPWKTAIKTSKVGKFSTLNEALWIYIITLKPLRPAGCLVLHCFRFPAIPSCMGPVNYMQATNYNCIISLLFLSALERAPAPNCTVTLLEWNGGNLAFIAFRWVYRRRLI